MRVYVVRFLVYVNMKFCRLGSNFSGLEVISNLFDICLLSRSAEVGRSTGQTVVSGWICPRWDIAGGKYDPGPSWSPSMPWGDVLTSMSDDKIWSRPEFAKQLCPFHEPVILLYAFSGGQKKLLLDVNVYSWTSYQPGPGFSIQGAVTRFINSVRFRNPPLKL